MSPSTSTDGALAGARTPALLRLRDPLLVAALGAAAATALLLRDPHRSGSWGYCPFLVLTGRPCPACGGLRATDDLLHGDLTAALGSNAYVVATIGLGLVLWGTWLIRRLRDGSSRWTPWHGRLATWWLVGLVAFGALRFLPGLTGLQP